MKTITVETSNPYEVHIGSGLLRQLGVQAAKVSACTKAAIISDSNVWPIYGKAAQKSLKNAGINAVYFTFPAGENSKIPKTYLEILNFLSENEITRGDLIIALGGGVVGDLAGFVAATYMRGTPYIQVPTSLLAMVDSSVGGKCAIDLPAGKNLCGAFYQPKLVLCDTDTLLTLPEGSFRDGCAEVIKYGILFDPALFGELCEKDLNFDRSRVIARCVELKNNTVAGDEFDEGLRKLLNLGHTVGHSVEKCSNYTISHGQAVAIGMAVIARASGCCDSQKIVSCLEKFGLPTKTDFTAEQLANCALTDKKRRGDTVDLIIPTQIGKCYIVPTAVKDLKSFIEEGL